MHLMLFWSKLVVILYINKNSLPRKMSIIKKIKISMLFFLSHGIMTSNPPLLTFTWYKRQIYMITFLVSLHFMEKNVWRKIWYGQNCSINQTQPRKYFGSCSLMFWRFYVINNRERYGTMLQNFLVQCLSCCYFFYFIRSHHSVLFLYDPHNIFANLV